MPISPAEIRMCLGVSPSFLRSTPRISDLEGINGNDARLIVSPKKIWNNSIYKTFPETNERPSLIRNRYIWHTWTHAMRYPSAKQCEKTSQLACVANSYPTLKYMMFHSDHQICNLNLGCTFKHLHLQKHLCDAERMHMASNLELEDLLRSPNF